MKILILDKEYYDLRAKKIASNMCKDLYDTDLAIIIDGYGITIIKNTVGSNRSTFQWNKLIDLD